MSKNTTITAEQAKRQQYLMANVLIEGNGCWTWTGASYGDGYGQARYEGTRQGAHVFALQAWHGPLKPGQQAGHVGCANSMCVNPHHLEPQTASKNQLEAQARRSERRVWTDADRAQAKADVLYGTGTFLEKAQRNRMSRTLARLVAKGQRWQDVEVSQ